jgi:hypothetical protein
LPNRQEKGGQRRLLTVLAQRALLSKNEIALLAVATSSHNHSNDIGTTYENEIAKERKDNAG